MRRTDREIKDAAAIRAIMEEALVCRIGLSDDGMPYVVPMNYGLGENCLYLHCAAEGRKLDILRRNNRVCFEMDLLREIKQGAEPCGWGALYESVIGFGRAVIVEEPCRKEGRPRPDHGALRRRRALFLSGRDLARDGGDPDRDRKHHRQAPRVNCGRSAAVKISRVYHRPHPAGLSRSVKVGVVAQSTTKSLSVNNIGPFNFSPADNGER